MDVYPTNLKLADDHRLLMEWSDGRKQEFTPRQLRSACPCATCREKRNAAADPLALPVLKDPQAGPLRILGMQPVGNYAYTIAFSDGHDTGIYSFDLLRELGK